jgi:nitrogen regulatory protein PII
MSDNSNNIMMKRVEAYVSSEKAEAVLTALESSNFQATFFESKGMGKGEKRELSFKGRTMKMRYSIRSTIVTIVDEDKLKEVIAIIKESGSTGTTSSGVVVISPVEDLLIL